MSKIRDIYNAITGKKNPGELDKQATPAEVKSLISDLEGVVNGQLYTLSTTTNTKAYSNNYVVHRASNLVANSLAELPLRIYRGQDPMEPGYLLPGLFNLDMPNPNLPLSELIYRSILYYINKGDLFIEVEEDPLRWTPRNPANMTEQAGAWKYQSKTENRIIQPEGLIHLSYFDPYADSYDNRGLSPVKVVEQEISNDNKAREYNSKFFENFGRVGIILKNLSIGGGISEEQMKKIVDQFNAIHAGSGKAWKAMGLPNGIDYEEFANNMRDMEFAQGRIDNRDRILAVLGVHKSLIGATDSVDRAVADTAMRQLYIHTTKPLARRLQQAINLQFFRIRYPAFHCMYDFSNVDELKEARTEKLERAKSYRDLGYTMNEINSMLDLEMDEVTDELGDMRFVPSSLIPASDLMFEPIPPAKDINNSKTIDKLVEFIEKDSKETENKASRGSYIRSWNRLQRSSERQIKSKIRKHFSAQLLKVLNIVYSNDKTVKNINEILIMAELKALMNGEKDILVSMLKPTYETVSKDASELAINAMRLNIPSRIKDDIVNNSVFKIRDIEDSAYNLFRQELKASVQAGETITQLAERVKKVGKFNSGYAATRVARTESARLVNACTLDEYKTNNVEKKSIVTAGDDKVRDTHAQNAGDGAIPMNQAFSGTQEQFPGESEINCRCALLPIISGS